MFKSITPFHDHILAGRERGTTAPGAGAPRMSCMTLSRLRPRLWGEGCPFAGGPGSQGAGWGRFDAFPAPEHGPRPKGPVAAPLMGV